LRRGDEVLNPLTGGKQRITELVRGPEKLPMVEVMVGSNKLLITSQHPMYVRETQGGIPVLVAAESVKPGQWIVGAAADRKVDGVRRVDMGPGYLVYNFKLGGAKFQDHIVEANGIVTGDLNLQLQLAETLEKPGKKFASASE
jgi:hypothetical protein